MQEQVAYCSSITAGFLRTKGAEPVGFAWAGKGFPGLLPHSIVLRFLFQQGRDRYNSDSLQIGYPVPRIFLAEQIKM